MSNECEYCYEGFHLNNRDNSCQPNICYCQNGYPDNETHVGSHICNVNNGHECSGCDQFHYLLGENCQKNRCTCKNGIQEEKNCKQHNENNCESCLEGFHKVGKFCLQNKCRCENGFPGKCSKNGQVSCSSCFEGYHLHNQRCVENQCRLKDVENRERVIL